MSNKQSSQSRLLINIIGIPLLLLSIAIGGLFFSLLILFAMIVCIEELHSILLLKQIKLYRFNFYLFYLLLLFELLELNIFPPIFSFSYILLFLISLFVFEFTKRKKISFYNILVNIFCLFWVAFSLNFVIKIRLFNEYEHIGAIFEFEEGFYLTLLMFISIWSCDSFSYIFGSKFGKKKIFPSVSPNKTWVGSISGFLMTSILVYILYLYGYFKFSFVISTSIFDVIVICFIFGIVSQIGDFIESYIKRKIGVKDSGNILRGHGGMLDRLDSLILVAPTFYFYLKYFLGIDI